MNKRKQISLQVRSKFLTNAMVSFITEPDMTKKGSLVTVMWWGTEPHLLKDRLMNVIARGPVQR